MNVMPVSPVIRNSISAAPDLIMGLGFLVSWIDPNAGGEHTLHLYATIMTLEFFTIHSTAFLLFALFIGTSFLKKIVRTILIGSFYTVFMWSFCIQEGVWWPLWTFWLLILNRMMSVLIGENTKAFRQIAMLAMWGWSVVCYILAIVVTFVLPLPVWGWTNEYIRSLPKNAGGIWFAEPQTLFAAGFLYFTSVAVFELKAGNIMKKFSDIDPKIPLFRTKNVR